MPITCAAPSCISPASHRVVVRARNEASDGPAVLLCSSHAGTLKFSLVTDVLASIGLAVFEVTALTDA